MKKFAISLILGLFLCSSALAQVRVHVGATTAVNSTFVLDQGLLDDPRYNSTFSYDWAPLGLAVGADFSSRFGLQLETILSKQGQIFDVIDVTKQIVGERKIDLQYVHIPLLFKFMSAKTTKARMNFSIGPQLSLLTDGTETLQYAASIQEIPDGVEIPEGALENGDGTYDVPALTVTELLSTSAENELEKFKQSEVQIAGNLGVDIDVTPNIYLSMGVRANYSLTDMRNEELLATLKQGSNLAQDIFGKRANVLVGVQFGVHYMFGGVPSAAR